MNLTKLLFGLLFFTLLSSCTEGIEDIVDENLLQGTWKAISFEAEIEAEYIYNGESSTMKTVVEGSDLDYEVTFDESTFSTNGEYTVTYTLTLDGEEFPPATHTATDVNGDGTYMVEGDTLTIDGVLYELEFNGIDYNAVDGVQSAEYTFNENGELVVIQSAVIETDQANVSGSATIVSNSVWVKQ